MVTIDFKLDVKLESSEAYLLKLGKNPLKDFECGCKCMPLISNVFIPKRT